MRVPLKMWALVLFSLTVLALLAQTGGIPFAGLQLVLSLDGSPVEAKAPKFRAEFRNVGTDDLVFSIGFMLANGKKQYPDKVVLTLTDSQGKSRQLNLKCVFRRRRSLIPI
jgi:hypothetical protein